MSIVLQPTSYTVDIRVTRPSLLGLQSIYTGNYNMHFHFHRSTILITFLKVYTQIKGNLNANTPGYNRLTKLQNTRVLRM